MGFMEYFTEKQALVKALDNAQETIKNLNAENVQLREYCGMPIDWLPGTEEVSATHAAAPGIGSIDADGLSYLCNGSFSYPCTVEKIANAMVVQGMFGTPTDPESSFGIVLADDVAVRSLSQILMLLTPMKYTELASALYLSQYEPLFLPGSWSTLNGREHNFRTMPPTNGTFLTMIPAKSLVDENTGENIPEKVDELLVFIEEHSSIKGDGPKYIQTEACILFPIIADSVVARLNSAKQITGLKLEKAQPFGRWEGTELAEVCMATWNYCCPGVNVGGVKPASNQVKFPGVARKGAVANSY